MSISEHSVERRGESREVDFGDLLSLVNGIADAELRAKDSIEGSIDVSVPRMSSKGAGLARQRQGGAIADDRSEPVPAGLDYNIRLSSSHKAWS